jgi:flagellum-specific ATP synthase
VPVEVVGFRESRILLMPLGNMYGVGPGSFLIPTYRARTVRVGPGLLGRVIGGLGQPIDGGPPPPWEEARPLHATPPPPLSRRRIVEPIATGINAIDGCITCGKGQRVAIMSGSGVGKSKLVGMIARNTNADVNVIALIGERGREVRDFIELDLGQEGLSRSVVVVATSDEPALVRLSGAYTATAIAEYFRAQGADVMLMMDSVTRFAMAQREVGLAVGEPPTTKGYPPSVYALLPRLVERAGTSEKGSITGFYAVLVEADDFNDPIGDAVRSITDGHVALSRDLASRGHYPAVDVLESVSRTMMEVVSENHRKLAIRMRQALSTYRDAEDLVNIGAYVAGSNPEIDSALRLMPKLRGFLQQGLYEKARFDDLEDRMSRVLKG